MFALSGLEAAQAQVEADPGLELDNIINKTVRSRANAVSSPAPPVAITDEDQIGDSLDMPVWIQTNEGAHQISLTKYLAEISKIGANGIPPVAHTSSKTVKAPETDNVFDAGGMVHHSKMLQPFMGLEPGGNTPADSRAAHQPAKCHSFITVASESPIVPARSMSTAAP